jgi:hypothetical protein
MRIELTASIRGVAELVVTALLPNGVVLHRADHGADAECFFVLDAERHPGSVRPGDACIDSDLRVGTGCPPYLFHRNGGFWQLDPVSGQEIALTPGVASDGGRWQFTVGGDRRRAGPGDRRALFEPGQAT